MKEIVVLSGKGGTGKTSLTACFAAMAHRAVIADCDVDAADLHLLFAPRPLERHEFLGGRTAAVREQDCSGCGGCAEVCRFGAIAAGRAADGERVFRVDPLGCEGCGVCVRLCPAGAIDFPERVCGAWMVSETRCGTLFHAQLGTAAENSGRLVSLVRREARRLAERSGAGLLLVDGPPGIGCPVIASLTGADLALVVTEPTLSGEHDLQRVVALASHFQVPVAVCVNKWDINGEVTERIERAARRLGGHVVGRIGYDAAVVRAQIEGRTAIEAETPSAGAIAAVWRRVRRLADEEPAVPCRPVTVAGRKLRSAAEGPAS
ncbi:MAG TPA: ATP-binding protein [Vicinamibacteria bacterium]|nr:ATP-binding protein [Vicinamibacteria bacterium]